MTVLRVEMTVEVVVEELMEAKKSFGFLQKYSLASFSGLNDIAVADI